MGDRQHTRVTGEGTGMALQSMVPSKDPCGNVALNCMLSDAKLDVVRCSQQYWFYFVLVPP